MEVIAEATNGQEAVQFVQELSPDVVIMDVSMSILDGVEATVRIVRDNPKVKVLALSMHSTRRFVVDMFKAGASGYLLKECAFEELIHAIRAAVADEIYLSPKIANVVISDLTGRAGPSDQAAPVALTEREIEVLQLLAGGKSTKQIALHIDMSTKTVEACRRRIMDKLKVYTLPELTKYAIREGLTPLES